MPANEMTRLAEEIGSFLSSCGIRYDTFFLQGQMFLKALHVSGGKERELIMLPVPAMADSTGKAMEEMVARAEASDSLAVRPVIIPEDRWRAQPGLTRMRILAHLGMFRTVFARNCETRKIDRASAGSFLDRNHCYGAAQCRYCYGLFLKRTTGISEKRLFPETRGRHGDVSGIDIPDPQPGELIAVGTFSNARRWVKGEREIRSYEWVRYASLSGTRVTGGMGKILGHFISDVKPDDVMSYADLEWSDGEVYRKLGFAGEGTKAPVVFRIDMESWARTPLKGAAVQTPSCGQVFHVSPGSLKYRLKLTDYDSCPPDDAD